jgi:hypothetical protein
MTDTELEQMKATFHALLERQRIVMEQMQRHGKKFTDWQLYAAEVDRITDELGKLTGADQEPDWPRA